MIGQLPRVGLARHGERELDAGLGQLAGRGVARLVRQVRRVGSVSTEAGSPECFSLSAATRPARSFAAAAAMTIWTPARSANAIASRISRSVSACVKSGCRFSTTGTSDSRTKSRCRFGPGRLRVRARIVQQPRDAIELRVALFLQVVVGAIRRGAAAAAAAASAAADARELERDADRRRDRALFPGVAVEIHDRDLAAEQPPPGVTTHGGHAVGARTGIASLSLWNATCARSCGLKSSISLASPKPPGSRIVEADRRRASMKPG